MDKERLPRWGWLFGGLLVASLVGTLVNTLLLFDLGLPESYQVVTVITAMAPVLVYVGVWYDEDRQHYWENSQTWIVSDFAFVLFGATLGSSLALLAVEDVGIPQILKDLLGMTGGFMLSWGLFWWRNPEVYRDQ